VLTGSLGTKRVDDRSLHTANRPQQRVLSRSALLEDRSRVIQTTGTHLSGNESRLCPPLDAEDRVPDDTIVDFGVSSRTSRDTVLHLRGVWSRVNSPDINIEQVPTFACGRGEEAEQRRGI